MKRFNNILCVVDPEKTMDTAIIQSIRIANDHQSDITFMSVIKKSESWAETFRNKEDYTEDHNKLLEQKRSEIKRRLLSIAPSTKADIVVASGITYKESIKRVINQKHDLVVKCAEDMDWVDRLLVSEDMHLLRKCPCPVLLLKSMQKEGFQNVLATVDINDDYSELGEGRVQKQLNEQVLEYSIALCLPKLSQMHLGAAWQDYAEDVYRYGTFSSLSEQEVNQYAELTRREYLNKLETLVVTLDQKQDGLAVNYLQPKLHLVKGKASEEIPQMVQELNVDLIVMGTVGRVGIPGLIIGNTAESILEQVQCSVLAIKPEGFETPTL